MKVPYKPSFEIQRNEFTFKFTCEHCAHFDPKEESCLHEYPNKEHRLQFYTTNNPPDGILFCKDFDLA